jgi:hypothetical protein
VLPDLVAMVTAVVRQQAWSGNGYMETWPEAPNIDKLLGHINHRCNNFPSPAEAL